MQGPRSDMYALSGTEFAGSRVSMPQREPSRADQSGADDPHTFAQSARISPFKWWGERGQTEADVNIWLGAPDNKRVFHKDFWYDPEAILCRKPSVRFRRTVDFELPVYNQKVRLHNGFPDCDIDS
jgi:hypothetical protein